MRPSIPNWTSAAEGRELARLATGQLVLEVGSYRGFSAVLMALAGARQVWAVDWHRGDSGGDPGLGEQDTLCAWWRNLRHHQVEDLVVGLVGRTTTVLPMLRPRSFDVALIDAGHAYEQVAADIMLTEALIKPGGLIAFHDYSPDLWPGVVRAVDEWRSDRPLRVVDSLAMAEI